MFDHLITFNFQVDSNWSILEIYEIEKESTLINSKIKMYFPNLNNSAQSSRTEDYKRSQFWAFYELIQNKQKCEKFEIIFKFRYI